MLSKAENTSSCDDIRDSYILSCKIVLTSTLYKYLDNINAGQILFY